MAWTIPKTWNTNDLVAAADLNTHLRDNLSFLKSEGAHVTKSANQTLTNNTTTVITWDTEAYDSDTMHDNVTNNSRITINTAGKYLIIATIRFYPHGTGFREVVLRKNGVGVIAQWQFGISASAPMIVQIVTEQDLAATDYLDVTARQTSGGNLDLQFQHMTFIARKVA